MKATFRYILIAVLAGITVRFQPLIIYGTDNFAVTADNHKVFSYGFPLRIHDSAAPPCKGSGTSTAGIWLEML
jgi:hypothetical protein